MKKHIVIFARYLYTMSEMFRNYSGSRRTEMKKHKYLSKLTLKVIILALTVFLLPMSVMATAIGALPNVNLGSEIALSPYISIDDTIVKRAGITLTQAQFNAIINDLENEYWMDTTGLTLASIASYTSIWVWDDDYIVYIDEIEEELSEVDDLPPDIADFYYDFIDWLASRKASQGSGKALFYGFGAEDLEVDTDDDYGAIDRLHGGSLNLLIEIPSGMRGDYTYYICGAGYSYSDDSYTFVTANNGDALPVIDGRYVTATLKDFGQFLLSAFPTSASNLPEGTPPTQNESLTISASGGAGDIENVPVTVNNITGEVTIVIDKTMVGKLIENAFKAANAAGGDAVPTVTFDLSALPNAKAVTLDTDEVRAFSDVDVTVVLILPGATIGLDSTTFKAVASIAGFRLAPITVGAAVVPIIDLNGMQAAQVRGYETVVGIDVFIGENSASVPLTAGLPYKLKSNENPNAVRVWHLDENGNLTKLNGTYNQSAGMIALTIQSQNYFVVGYDPVTLWMNIFSDVPESAWYYDAVAYVSFNELFEGVGGGLFSPNNSMSRAMFAQVLWNLEGKPDLEYSVRFADVTDNAWYRNAVCWAAESAIVEGHNGLFSPDRAITRQEVSVILYRYANFRGYDIPENRKLNFSDALIIDDWASDAATALANAGILNGMGDNLFAPQQVATRAQVAQMFKNFVRFIV